MKSKTVDEMLAIIYALREAIVKGSPDNGELAETLGISQRGANSQQTLDIYLGFDKARNYDADDRAAVEKMYDKIVGTATANYLNYGMTKAKVNNIIEHVEATEETAGPSFRC